MNLILSVSRRTDIPAFYLDWFFNRLNEGFVLVRNPMNYHQVSEVILTPDIIDCIVFWTKDPRKIVNKLELLSNYNYYFLITINPYDKIIEKNLPSENEIIAAFKELAQRIGPDRVIWRYDPIILTEEYNIAYHIKHFEILASQLYKYTNKCIISFLDIYQKTKANMRDIPYKIINETTMKQIAQGFITIGERHHIKIEICSELIDLSAIGIKQAKCIDDHLISQIVGESLEISKDRNQREACGCVTSIDIGAYNTCLHSCIYCYANFSNKAVAKQIKKHDKKSPMLIGNIEADDRITKRKMESYRKKAEQGELWC